VCCDALQTGWGKVDDMVIPIPNPQQLVCSVITCSHILHTMARCVLITVHTLAIAGET